MNPDPHMMDSPAPFAEWVDNYIAGNNSNLWSSPDTPRSLTLPWKNFDRAIHSCKRIGEKKGTLILGG